MQSIHCNLHWSNKEGIKQHLLKNCRITENNCWEWTRGKNGQGYGTQRINSNIKNSSKRYTVHRISKAIFHGFDIGSSLCICHHCDNRICFNPEHLFIGTIIDNNLDKEKKGRGNRPKGENHGNAKLTNKDILDIRKMSIEGISHRNIAKKFSVTKTSVGDVLRGKLWKHVQ